MSKRFIHSSGLVLEIDVNDAATPAMVYMGRNDRYLSTYNCALDTGTVGDEEYTLDAAQTEWLESFEGQVEHAFELARG